MLQAQKKNTAFLRWFDLNFWGREFPSARVRRRSWSRLLGIPLFPFGCYYGIDHAIREARSAIAWWGTGDWWEIATRVSLAAFYLSIVRAGWSWFREGWKTVLPDVFDQSNVDVPDERRDGREDLP